MKIMYKKIKDVEIYMSKDKLFVHMYVFSTYIISYIFYKSYLVFVLSIC